MSNYYDDDELGDLDSPVRVLRSGTGTLRDRNKVAVADPTDPSRLIFVEARPDANGNLMPVDPRYDVRRGYNNLAKGGDSLGSLMLVAVAALGLIILTRK